LSATNIILYCTVIRLLLYYRITIATLRVTIVMLWQSRGSPAKSASAFALVFFVLIESRYLLSSNTRTNGRPRKRATCMPDAYNSDNRDYSRFGIDIAYSYKSTHTHTHTRVYCRLLVFVACKRDDFSVYTMRGTHNAHTWNT
jgi:hypothetical protein